MAENTFRFQKAEEALEEMSSIHKKLNTYREKLWFDIAWDLIFLTKTGGDKYKKKIHNLGDDVSDSNFYDSHWALEHVYNKYLQCEKDIVSHAAHVVTTKNYFTKDAVRQAKSTDKKMSSIKKQGEQSIAEMAWEIATDVSGCNGVFNWAEDFFADLPVSELSKQAFTAGMDAAGVTGYYKVLKGVPRGDWASVGEGYLSILGKELKKKTAVSKGSKQYYTTESYKSIVSIEKNAFQVFLNKDSFFHRQNEELSGQVQQYWKNGEVCRAIAQFVGGETILIGKAATDIACKQVESKLFGIWKVEDFNALDFVNAGLKDITGTDYKKELIESVNDWGAGIGDRVTEEFNSAIKDNPVVSSGTIAASKSSVGDTAFPMQDVLSYESKLVS